jgi:hypothetical protein
VCLCFRLREEVAVIAELKGTPFVRSSCVCRNSQVRSLSIPRNVDVCPSRDRMFKGGVAGE